MPMGVHEILHDKKVIDDDFLIGIGEKIKWVAEQDWTYRCSFKAPSHKGPAYLYFGELDTIVKVKLNGKEIAKWEDMFLPLRVDVTGKLKEENLLELHFQSPYTYLKEHPLPAAWKGKVRDHRVFRKPSTEFGNYLGAQPYITLIGVFGDVCLELIDEAELITIDSDCLLSNGYNRGAVTVSVSASKTDGVYAELSLFDPKKKKIDSVKLNFSKKGEAKGCLLVWAPLHTGNQTVPGEDRGAS
jgi:beta-galactosidase/beta-glucuronidase